MCGMTISRPGSDVTPELAAVAEIAHSGDYLRAAELCRAAMAASSTAEATAALANELERLAYVLRPTRGDFLAQPFAGLDQALARMVADSSLTAALRARLLAAQARSAAWQSPAAGLCLAREALAAADASNDQLARFLALFALHYGLEDPDCFDERRRVSSELLAEAQKSGDLEQRVIAHWRSMIDAWAAGDSAGYDLHLTRFLSASRALGDPHWEAMATSARAARALHEGLYDEARAAATLAERSGIPAAIDASAIQFGVAGADQAVAREVEPRHVNHMAANRAIYIPQRIGLASLLMSAGRLSEARAEADLAPPEALPRDGSYLPALCLSADLYTHLDFPEERIDQVYELLSPYAGRMAIMGDAVACFGPVDLYLGCIGVHRGDHEATNHHIEAGYVISARMRGRPWLARMARDRVIATPATDEQRQQWVTETLEIAEELGMRKVAASAREMLRSGKPTQAPRPPEERLGKALTPREEEILGLLAEGETASAIANALILSTRTVQKHIEHIYEKLGVQNRHQLVAREHIRSNLQRA